MNFEELRKANVARVGLFKNRLGFLAHSKPDGSDWSPAQWLQVLVGELGEYANFRKKFERGDLTLEEFNEAASKEIADVQIYLDLLAAQLGFDLGEVTRKKFNETSARIGVNIYI